MSSEKLGSPPPKLRKTEDREDSESHDDLLMPGFVEDEFTRAMAEKDGVKNESLPGSLTNDDGGQRSDQPTLTPVHHQTVVTPVDPLPDEVWKNVFDKMDSEDMLSCLRATTKWHNLLGIKRTSLLFPEVASILLASNDAALVECRKVCKSWKEYVDTQDHQSLVLLSFEKRAADDNRTVVFESIEKIRQFLGEMESHPGNPFPWRSIKIGLHTLRSPVIRPFTRDVLDAHLREFVTCLTHLLDAFGHYIYYLALELNIYYWPPGNQDLIREVLLRLPNLRKLELDLNKSDEFELQAEPVVAYYAENPLPQLVHLETMKLLRYMEDAAVPILCSCIVPQSIKRMEVPNFYEAMHSFPNLEEFKGGRIDCDELERFRNVAQRPPIKKLVFRAWTEQLEGMVEFQPLFLSLTQFADSLEYLHVDGFSLPPTLRDTDFRINLPKLKYLRLYLSYLDGYLDTLIELCSLTDLDVDFVLGMWDRATLTVLGIQKPICESNIWELMPSLQNLILRDSDKNEYGEHKSIGWKYKRDSSTGLIVEVEGYDFSENEEESDDNVEENENENNSQEDIDGEGSESSGNDDEDNIEYESDEGNRNGSGSEEEGR